MSDIPKIKVKFYERHEDGEAVYSRKAYDYFCRFPNVKVGTPVVVESAFGLGLAKVVELDTKSDKATKHVVGFVVTEVPELCEDEGCPQSGTDHVCVEKPKTPAPPPPKAPGLKPPTGGFGTPPQKTTPIEDDEIPD